MEKYNPQEVEKKWQEKWENESMNRGIDFDKRPKFYNLMEFPYPSGYGLHVGHCMGYTASDVYSRMKRMQGFNVLFPMGWDAFGLPTENYAIKTGQNPAEVTKENTDVFRRQMMSLAYSFDWDREINTTDPEYYKWTQWIFLQFYKHGIVDNKLVEVADDDAKTPRLAYQAEMPINWCPSCKIGLANEEVIDGKCERCGAQTYKKMQKQWMLRITAYADRLVSDLDQTDYLEKIKTSQVNWIGKSEGAIIKFKISNLKFKTNTKDQNQNLKKDSDDNYIEVFTTRADTLFGCTYLVLSPEHKEIRNPKLEIRNIKEVEKYIDDAKKKSDLERTELQKDKTGVKLEGIRAINPINNEEVDVWVADYVLASYGTGAVMAVPAHDERDFEFARKFQIPVIQSVAPLFTTVVGPDRVRVDKKTVKRKMIAAIVKHWHDDKIFVLDWEKFNWGSFILGGIEENETAEEAAVREVKEESGYQNIKSVKKIGFETHSNFFAHHKDENRYSMSDCYVVELADDTYIEPGVEHVKNHKGKWVDTNDVSSHINLHNNVFYWNIYQNGEKAFTDYGIMMNSGEFDGLTSEEGKKKVTEKLISKEMGNFEVNYKLRDWVFSRQHYWGEPIPVIHCKKCGIMPMNEKELPLTLPEVEKYEPTNTGESPLASIESWVNVKCPKCGGVAKRETDTMPNWAGSSWYYLAYAVNQESRIKNHEYMGNIFDSSKKELDYWMPVDLYNGGMEHTNLHLLYSRFWHKFLYDMGKVNTSEPYKKRIAHGIILGPNGQKMSKSKGNVINPDEIVKKYGADAMRTYIMFIGPYDQESAWSVSGLQGVYRFLQKVWINQDKVKKEVGENIELKGKFNRYINAITDDLENFRLNTYVAKLMEMNNEINKVNDVSKELYEIFLRLLAPAVPHIAEELWHNVGNIDSVFKQDWPKADEKYLTLENIVIGVQINGKLRGTIKVASQATEDEVMKEVRQDESIIRWVEGRKLIKVIYKAGKIISLVVSE